MSEGSETKVKLRREVTVWGSFCWGYADVGADVYAALGLVMAAAQGATPLAFAIAGIVYIFVGLAYTEMAAAYPVAGGGHYFTLRGLGDFWGLVAGAALMLDYTVDVALFAIASAGYINFFFPVAREFSVNIGPFQHVNLIWLGESVVLIVFLAILNIKGVRESSLFNEVLGALDMLMELASSSSASPSHGDLSCFCTNGTTNSPRPNSCSMVLASLSSRMWAWRAFRRRHRRLSDPLLSSHALRWRSSLSS